MPYTCRHTYPALCHKPFLKSAEHSNRPESQEIIHNGDHLCSVIRRGKHHTLEEAPPQPQTELLVNNDIPADNLGSLVTDPCALSGIPAFTHRQDSVHFEIRILLALLSTIPALTVAIPTVRCYCDNGRRTASGSAL